MSVIASITTSVDGYVTGPDDRPGQGLGIGGERLHHWVMGGPWTYDGDHDPAGMVGADREFFDDLVAGFGAGVCGRGMYDAAGGWGGTNPFGGTMFVLTHRTGEAPDPSTGFVFVDDLATAMDRASAAAAGGDVSIGGGADVIRQALTAGYVDELAISTAPVVLGAGKRLFDGFRQDIDLEVRRVYTSPYATHVRYALRRP
jgi:dihydrofolate reductase